MQPVQLDLSDHAELRVAIVSDTHGTLNPNIKDIVNDCDIALHAGDIMGAAPLDALTPKLGIVLAVLGNNDYYATWDHTEHAVLHDIPEQILLKLPGGQLAMEHSHRRWNRDYNVMHDALRQTYPDTDLIVYGHTHQRVIDDQVRPWVVNPGAAGQERVEGGPSCLVLVANREKWAFEEHVFKLSSLT